jgi:nitronate monooxygenase
MNTTRLLALLRTQHPVLQAPLAGSQNHALAIAVAQAGGLGALPAAMLSPASLSAELAAFRQACPRAPINVNFFCHTMPSADPHRESVWLAALRPYHDEYGIDPAVLPAGPLRLPFDEQGLAVLAEYRPEVVSFHFGLPRADLLTEVKALGASVVSSATTVAEAQWLQAHGADVIVAQGLEAGGHRGHFLSDDLSLQMGTFALLPQVVKAVNVPVVAAGGLGTDKSVLAARALGASGVQVGTAYLRCNQATTSAVHRAALASAAAAHTAVTRLFSGRPARGVVNRLITELGAMSPLAPAFPLAAGPLAPLRAAAERQGSGDFSPLWAGQAAHLCMDTDASDLTHRLGQAWLRGNT